MWRRLVLALAAALGLGVCAEAAPLDAYGKLPSIEQAEISPSGTLMAFIATDGDKRTIIVQTTADRAPVLIGPLGDAKVRAVTWAGDDHLILTHSTTNQPTDVSGPRVEHLMAHDVNLKTKRLRNLLSAPLKPGELSMDEVLGPPEVRMIKGRMVAFVRGITFVGGKGQVGLFQVDMSSGSANLKRTGDGGAYDWLLDKDGQVLAEASYKDASGIWSLEVRSRDGGWRKIEKTLAPVDQPDLVGLSADGRAIVVATPVDETYVWRELSLETGAWSDPAKDQPAAAAVFAAGETRIIGKHKLDGDREAYTFFSSQDAAVWRGIEKAFPGDAVTLASWSEDRKKIVVRVDSAELGPAFSLVDLGSLRATWLGAEYGALKETDLSPRKATTYKAADGLQISGYLTLPSGRPAKNLPLVVLVHGGPAARDEPGFDWWPQAIASRGYAVLQPNYRGSTGFGSAFRLAGYGEWGRKMQTDLSDGVRKLVADGVVDANRVCIVGASYGGYAALAGATMDHGVYRCAVSVGGVSDLRDLTLDSGTKGGRSSKRYWLRFMGAKDLKDPVLARYSPAARAAEADIPILLIHGRDDTVVPISQARKMAKALQAAGKPVQLIEMAGEDHWLSRGATRLQMLQASVDFLEKNNPPN